jgi:hypothetical protein
MVWTFILVLFGLATPQAALERDPLTAWRYAQRVGKPLLIIVVPEAPVRQRRWEQALSVMLNADGDRINAALSRHHVIVADRILLKRIGVEARGLAIQMPTHGATDAPAVWQVFSYPVPDLIAASKPDDPVLERVWHQNIEPITQSAALRAVRPLKTALTNFLEQAPQTSSPRDSDQLLSHGFPGGSWVETPGGCVCTRTSDGSEACGFGAERPPILQRTLRLKHIWQR